ncbi:hypothetical protein MMC25_006263 [Agyrium rufum]|nr:hypothetical protein [Agyrium rufum]
MTSNSISPPPKLEGYSSHPGSKSEHLTDESEQLLLDDGYDIGPEFTTFKGRVGPKKSRLYRLLPWICHGVLLTASLVFFSLAIHFSGTKSPTIYPVVGLGLVEIDYMLDNPPRDNSTQEFLGLLAKPYASSYIGPPQGALDAAWRRITEFEPLPVSAEIMQEIDVEHYSKLPADLQNKDGLHVDGTAYHQLHCLNFLRLQVFRNHYLGWSPSFGPDGMRKDCRYHMEHCLEMMSVILLDNDYEKFKDTLLTAVFSKCPS